MFVRTESAPQHRDWWLIGSVVGLLAIGLQMVYSSSVVVAHNEFGDDTYFVLRHAAWLIIGFILTYITSRIDYHIWQRVSVLLMGLCLVSLVIVLVPTFGSTAYGAQRWLKLGPIQLGQPSELAKIVLVLYMADWLSRKGEQVRHFTYGSLPFAIIVGLVAGLVMTFLRRQLRERDLRELLLASELISAQRACQIGLVNRVVPVAELESEVQKIVGSVLQGAPGAITNSKRLMEELWSTSVRKDIETALRHHLDARESAEAKEGIAAFNEKRPPNWAAQASS